MAVHPIEFRYAYPEMKAVWGADHRLRLLLQVEVALARGHAKLGRIPEDAADAIARGADRVTLARVREIEDEIHHETMAVVRALAEVNDGAGPFPTEMAPEKVEELGWEEYGAVTGRPRRIGEFDYEAAKRSAMINGATHLAVTCLDRRFPEVFAASRPEDLSSEARGFLDGIREAVGVPVTLISTGPEREHMIDLR